jgi:hypothetical protein
MKTKRELAIEQIELQEKMQRAGINLVTCGNCGAILLHSTEQEEIECFCGRKMDLSDCPDYWYEGCQDNAEFEDN